MSTFGDVPLCLIVWAYCRQKCIGQHPIIPDLTNIILLYAQQPNEAVLRNPHTTEFVGVDALTNRMM